MRNRARIPANVASPMPGTSRSWSTLRKGPWIVRKSTILAAVAGPIRAVRQSCSAVALLRSKGHVVRRRIDAGRCRRGGTRGGRRSHPYLFTIAELPREVDALGRGSWQNAACGGDRLGDPRATGQSHDAGTEDLAGHVDGHATGRCRRPGGRIRRHRAPGFSTSSCCVIGRDWPRHHTAPVISRATAARTSSGSQGRGRPQPGGSPQDRVLLGDGPAALGLFAVMGAHVSGAVAAGLPGTGPRHETALRAVAAGWPRPMVPT